ncbi:MAG: hypothetical protein OHK0022_50740 [Roseiflexaceae bacterium]
MHLLLAEEEQDYCRWYTGNGSERALLCEACAKDATARDTALRLVCSDCLERVTTLHEWEHVAGMPSFRERRSGLRFEQWDVALPDGAGGPLHAIVPVDNAPGSLWIALVGDGQLVRLDLDQGTVEPLVEIPSQPARPLMPAAPVTLQLSGDGRFVAAVNTYGRSGVVIDLARRKPAMWLERDNYHQDVCVFPVAFFTHNGRTLLVHATGWNRLDISDPTTGALLTGRGPTSYTLGEKEPKHYLDYFHCGLSVAPGQEWIVDNGWVWHPWGIVRSWSLSHWCEENVWESEDGPSLRALIDRSDLWDAALCWVDATTLAVWGEGLHNSEMIPAVALFNVASGECVRWFAGPDVAPHSVWPPSSGRRGWMAFDQWLFAISPQHGTGIWDIATGERLHHDPDFAPTAYHPGARQWLNLREEGTLRLGRLLGEAEV